MIGKLRALQEVRRFRATNYFAALDDDGVNELARMLSFANDEIVAVAVVNDWLEEQTERPTPADIRRLVTLHNSEKQTDQARKTAACDFCGGTGFQIVERGGLSGAKICRCRGGEQVA